MTRLKAIRKTLNTVQTVLKGKWAYILLVQCLPQQRPRYKIEPSNQKISNHLDSSHFGEPIIILADRK